MKYGEFMARLRQKKDLPHVFLLAGKESYFLRKAQERIVQLLFVRKEDMDQSLQKFNGNVELETPRGAPPVELRDDPAASQDPVFLRWDFINGLFLGILVLEFVIFPILFWMWFGPGSQRVDAVEKETSENEKR